MNLLANNKTKVHVVCSIARQQNKRLCCNRIVASPVIVSVNHGRCHILPLQCTTIHFRVMHFLLCLASQQVPTTYIFCTKQANNAPKHGIKMHIPRNTASVKNWSANRQAIQPEESHKPDALIYAAFDEKENKNVKMGSTLHQSVFSLLVLNQQRLSHCVTRAHANGI